MNLAVQPATRAGKSAARWVRIIPVTIIVYILAYMDRVNIGFAMAGGMNETLHLSLWTSGMSAGIFFLGYLVLQLPGGHLAEHGSARRFIQWSIASWAGISFLTGLARNGWELLTMRFLLGVAEGGAYPAILVLIGQWFPQEELGRANGLFLVSLPLSAAIRNPLSGSLAIFVNGENPIAKLTMKQLDGIFGEARTGGLHGTVWSPLNGRSASDNIRTWGELGLGGDWANQTIHTYGYAYTGMKWFFQTKVFHGGDKWNPTYREYVETESAMVDRKNPGGESLTIHQMLADLSDDKVRHRILSLALCPGLSPAQGGGASGRYLPLPAAVSRLGAM